MTNTISHKINHCLGEALLAKKMGKTKLIAETGAGQHGVALATTAALMQMECEIHMVRAYIYAYYVCIGQQSQFNELQICSLIFFMCVFCQ